MAYILKLIAVWAKVWFLLAVDDNVNRVNGENQLVYIKISAREFLRLARDTVSAGKGKILFRPSSLKNLDHLEWAPMQWFKLKPILNGYKYERIPSNLPYLINGKARGWFETETIGVGLVNAKHTGQSYSKYKAGYTPDGSSGKGEYFEVKSKVNGVFYTDSFKAR